MISLRMASVEDAPPLNSLILDHQDKYKTDYDQYDPAELLESIKNDPVLVFEKDGFAVGAIWFTNRFADLFIHIFTVIDPSCLLEIRRRKLFEQALDIAFQMGEVMKIKAVVHEKQTGVYKVLKNVLRFKECGYSRRETRINGKFMGVYLFELHKSFWERSRQEARKQAHT